MVKESNAQTTSPTKEAVEKAETIYRTVQRAFPEAVEDFESKWAAFQLACQSLPASASPVDCTQTHEFETVRDQGPKILPFVVFKIATDIDTNSYGAFLFNALAYDFKYNGYLDDDLKYIGGIPDEDPKYRGPPEEDPMSHYIPDDALTSEEALQRYSVQVVEFSYQRTKIYEKFVNTWKAYCAENMIHLCRAAHCTGDEYWDLLDMGPAFIPLLMVEYCEDRMGYWYELIHEVVHGRTTEAYCIYERGRWFDVWRFFLNGCPYKQAPKYIPNETDIKLAGFGRRARY